DVWTGLTQDLEYTLAHAPEWRNAGERYFSPDAFDYGGTPGTVFRGEVLNAMGQSGGDIFVLGDRPDLYILLRKPAPYYITYYNQSPIEAQARTVSWLEEHNPQFVFWDV